MPPPPVDDVDVAGVTFEKQVLPIFQTRCIGCHGGGRRKGGLDVRSVASLLRGGNSGPGVTPGSLEKSILWETVASDQMPPGKNKLSPADKAIIRRWIISGGRDGRLADAQPAKP
jgi:mono/diheme cytochrome c family protein